MSSRHHRPIADLVPRKWALPVVLLLAALALTARALPPLWSVVFDEPDGVRLLGVDPYYHLRHARFAAHHFPDLQRWDIGTHYPNGQRSDAIGLFDLAIGGVSWVIGFGQPTDQIVDLVCAWTPPVLAAASVVVLYLLARTVVSRPAALLACVIFLLYPGASLPRTLLGFADHHCAEIVLALMTSWALACCLRSSDGESNPSLWRPAFLHASPLAVFLFTWAGAPVFLLITAITLWGVTTVEILHGTGSATAARTSFRYGSGLLVLVAGAGFLWPQLVISLDRFPFLLLGCVIVALGPAVYHGAARLLVRTGLGTLLTAATLSFILAVFTWFLIQYVPITKSLLSLLLVKGQTLAEHNAVTWETYWSMLGMPGLLALICVPPILARIARDVDNRFLLVSVFPGVLVTSLWAYSHDYEYTPPPFVALLCTLVIVEVVRLLFPNGIARPYWKAGTGAVVAALVLVAPMWPLRDVPVPWVTARAAHRHLIVNDGWIQAMDWMRNDTPEPSLSLNTSVEPWRDRGGFRYPPGTYGVFCPWDFGNMVSTLGHRVPVWSRWPASRTATWVLCEDEEESVRLLCPDCRDDEHVRYVVLEARSIAQHFLANVVLLGGELSEYDTRDQDRFRIRGAGPSHVLHRTYGPRYERSIAVRLYSKDGYDAGHYRLVYESPHQSYVTYHLKDMTGVFWRLAFPIDSTAEYEAASKRIGTITKAADHYEYDGLIASTVKIFERVAGARLLLTVAPGSIVEAHLHLRCGSDGRLMRYARTAVGGADGRFELVVAHPTESADGASACRASSS